MLLKCPQTNEHDKEYWSYALINEIHSGDVVFHYDAKMQAVIARSTAKGVVWEDEIFWAARGLSARSAHIDPHHRPGWYLGLEEFARLEKPLALDEIRSKQVEISSLLKALSAKKKISVYFPFELSDKRSIRPMQGYLFKRPRSSWSFSECSQ